MSKIVPIILCGGSGTRLWPLSRENYPKQFVDLGNGKTLFGDTLARCAQFADATEPICVCNEKYRFYVAQAIKKGLIILEPCARNTAAAMALAAFGCQLWPGAADLIMLVMPSDHCFTDSASFVSAAESAIPLAEEGKIITFGVTPDHPATGFGYIERGEAAGHGGFLIRSFVEKPEAARAEAMLRHGGFYWNAGIFMVKPEIYLAELEKHAPAIYEHVSTAWNAREQTDNLIRPQKEAFCSCPSDSVDYAVMERTRIGCVTPLAAGWNDMGSWESFHENAAKDSLGNACFGRALVKDCRQNYIHATGRLVAALGVDNLAIVETQDAVLVANRKELQNVRAIVERLNGENARESLEHRLVLRPWGSYEVLASGDRFQVKRIVVRPDAELSLQKHHHRAEHWIVVSGTAEVTNGGEIKLYTENESTFIPVGRPHKLRNPGMIPLVIIEIQSGSYLGEDDIVRLEDCWGRQGSE